VEMEQKADPGESSGRGRLMVPLFMVNRDQIKKMAKEEKKGGSGQKKKVEGRGTRGCKDGGRIVTKRTVVT